MATLWEGDIVLDSEVLESVQLTSTADDDHLLPPLMARHLHLLAYVDPDRIPLHLICGASCSVSSTNSTSLEWLQRTFSMGLSDPCDPRIDTNGTSTPPPDFPEPVQSSVGLLLKVNSEDSPVENGESPRLTEMLIYAVRFAAPLKPSSLLLHNLLKTPPIPNEHTTGLIFFALPLSSDLLYQPNICNFPPSALPPSLDVTPFVSTDTKHHLTTLFEEASDRRKKVRRKGAQSVRVAASRGNAPPSLRHPVIKSEEMDDAGIVRPMGRVTPTLVDATRPSSRSVSRKSFNALGMGSGTDVNGNLDVFIDTSFEARNKGMISRMVMACMRMYGLQQQRKPPSGPRDFATPMDEPVADLMALDSTNAGLNGAGHGLTDAAARAAKDAEFKGVYHQAYKGAVFALRRTLDTELLKSDAVRDVVDRLLALFCVEPP